LQSTGNAAKAGLAGAMHVSPSNFYIKPGEPSFDALMEKLGDGVFITELEGLHAGVDSISGDFSLSARGFRVEGGKKTTPVEQIVVSGNFYDLLENIEAIGNDLRFSMPSGGSIGSPSLIIKSINVAGE
jgi:PmbA protein